MNATSIIAGTIAGAIGAGYLLYGRKQSKLVPAICGILLMVYPYFTDNIWILLGVGAALGAAPFVIKA